MTGTLYGLGVGPGDPELITLKAHRLLQQVPVIAYAVSKQGESRARTTVAQHIPTGRLEIALPLPAHCDSKPNAVNSEGAIEDVAAALDGGQDVAVLCDGDPFFYGSFLPVFGRLAERFPIEIVPGISSLNACASVLGTPLVAQGEQLLVVPGSLTARTLTIKLSESDAAAIVALGEHFAKVRDCLAVTGLLPRSRYIEQATVSQQRILTLDQVDAAQVPDCSMILMRRDSKVPAYQ